MELNRENQKLKDKIEKEKYEKDKEERAKLLENSHLKGDLDSILKEFKTTQEELEEAKNKYLSTQDKLMEQTQKFNQIQKKIVLMEDELRNKDRMIENLSSNMKMSGKLKADGNSVDNAIFNTLMNLNKGVESLNGDLKKRNKQKIQRLNDEVTWKQDEINKLLEERQTYFQKIKSDGDKKVRELRDEFSKRVTELEEKIQMQYENNKTYKAELQSKKKLELELKRLKVSQKHYDDKLKSLNELINTKEEKNKVNQEAISNFIKEIEKLRMQHGEMNYRITVLEEKVEMENMKKKAVIKCVNTVVSVKDKKTISKAVKKLDRSLQAQLNPFFKSQKVKI